MSEATLNSLVNSLGFGAILAFFVWHFVSKAIPEIIKSFREELAAERIARKEDAQANRDESRANRDAIERLGERFERMTERIEDCQSCQHWSPRSQPPGTISLPTTPGQGKTP